MNSEHTDLIVRWYKRLGSERAVAEHLNCSRMTVRRHLEVAAERGDVEKRGPGRPPGS